jgi:biopolymer transport protein ExbD
VSQGSIFGGRQSMFGKEGSPDTVVDLNLTPLMDVMSNILFFLLASFGAAIVSFLNASVPVQSDSPPPEMRKDQVVLTLQITPKEFKLAASNDWIPAEDLKQLNRAIPSAGGTHDLKGLNQAIFRIKQSYPASDTVMLVPDETIPYDLIVATMEATREFKLESKRKVRLFPKVVVSGIIKSE